jgi:hypothetical protein
VIDVPSRNWAIAFVGRHKRLRELPPDVLDEARIIASEEENVMSFLAMLRDLIQKNNYYPDMMIQGDETSCQCKPYRHAKRIASETTTFLPVLKPTPIYHLTFLFLVTADGQHLPSTVIVPSWYDTSQLSEYRNENYHVRLTQKGWVTTDLFEDVMRSDVMKWIEERRKTITDEKRKRALLILDGHPSRRNLTLWKDFAAADVDVVIIPAHTSHLLQPLDLGVNAAFKQALRKAIPAPGKRAMPTRLLPFLMSLTDAAYQALCPHIIRAGFHEAGFTSPTTDHVREKTLKELPAALAAKKKPGRWTISGKLITDPPFLETWEQREAEKEEKERQLEERRRLRKERSTTSKGRRNGKEKQKPLPHVVVKDDESEAPEDTPSGAEESDDDSQDGEDKVVTITCTKEEEQQFMTEELLAMDKEVLESSRSMVSKKRDVRELDRHVSEDVIELRQRCRKPPRTRTQPVFIDDSSEDEPSLADSDSDFQASSETSDS